MKKKIQILLMISILLSGVSWLDCMMTSAARQTATKIRRHIAGGISTAAAARLAAVKSSTPLLARTVETKSDTSTWSGWFQSWFRGSQSTPVTSSRVTVARTARSPFAPIQSSAYHTTVPQKSFWNTISSFFQAKPLTSGELYLKIYWLILGHLVSPPGYEWIFDDKDYEKAKKEIDALLVQNPDYKNSLMLEEGADLAFKPLADRRSHSRVTMLDMVLSRIFRGKRRLVNDSSYVTLSEDVINLIKLANHLISKGLDINAENKRIYEYAYFDYFMNSYQHLFELDPAMYYGLEEKQAAFKEMFKVLDPLMEKLMPEFKDKISQAQQERVDIEINQVESRRKIQEQESRAEYIDLKTRRISDHYNQIVGDAYASYPYNFADKVKFDEQEYQAWVKNRRRGNSNARIEENNFNQGTPAEDQSTNDVLLKLKIDLGLPANASAIDVKKKFREISMLNHPDVREQGNATMTKEEYTNLNSAYSSVSEILDKQAREEKGKAVQQKARQGKERL